MEMKAENKKLVFGLDIGTRSVVGTIGYKEDEKFIVLAQEIREHKTRAMLDGQIHDIGMVASTIVEIKEALEQKTGMELTEVCIAAAGRVLKTMTVHVDMDFELETVMSEVDIAELTSRGVEKAFSEFHKEYNTNMKFYCVGYSVVKYYVNGEEIAKPVYHKCKTLGEDVIVTFLPSDVVEGLYSAVELAGLTVFNLTLEPIAAIRVAIPEKYRLLNLAMIDVGAGTSDISITNKGTITAFGMIPFAGDHMTECIAQKCLVDFETADKIKIAADKMDKITYTDIMGLEQCITAKEVIAACKPEIEKTAKLAAEEIRKLNNGEAPSAVFIVGGGGRIGSFTNNIAKELGIDLQRVAIRGEEIMNDIEFPEGCLKDSTIITPIGICLSAYDQTNKFINVVFNGHRMKLYDSNNLTVADAAIQASFSRESLFPKRGEAVVYTVNGFERITKGRYGESAKVFVNEEEADLNYHIKENDVILMEKSTIGEEATVRVNDIDEYNKKLNIIVNGIPVVLPKLFEVNGEKVAPDYEIKNHDSIVIHPWYTYNELLTYMNKVESKVLMTINTNLADKESVIKDGDILEILEKKTEEEKAQEEKAQEEKVQEEKATEPVLELAKSEEAAVDKQTARELSFEDLINREVLGTNDATPSEETVGVFKNMIENASEEEVAEVKEEEIIPEKNISNENNTEEILDEVIDNHKQCDTVEEVVAEEDFEESEQSSEETTQKATEDLDEGYYDDDEVEDETDEVMDADPSEMIVIINQKPVLLDGKDSYMFVDIFNYIDFDTSKMKGSGIVTTVNGKTAVFTQQLHVGDEIEVYWK